MRQAGYADSAWTMVVQNYASPIPPASGFRYGQGKLARQGIGGCGFWNRDADWANRTALATINSTVSAAVTASGVAGVKRLDLAASLNGRRLCEKGVGLLEEEGLSSWTQPGAVDRTEWVNQIRTVTTLGSYQLQESLHPELLGAARAAQLRAPGVERRLPAGRVVRGRGDRPGRRRAQDGAELAGGCGGPAVRRRTSAGPGA